MLVNFLWPANTRSTTTAQKVSVKGFFSKCKKIRKDKEILNEILHYLCSEYIVTAGMSYTWIDRGFFLIVTVWTETVLETDGLAEAAREIFISSKITFQNCISNINMQRSKFLKEYVLKIVVYIYSGFCYWVRAFVISKYNYRAMGVLTLCNMSHGPIVPFLWFFKVLNNVSDFCQIGKCYLRQVQIFQKILKGCHDTVYGVIFGILKKEYHTFHYFSYSVTS